MEVEFNSALEIQNGGCKRDLETLRDKKLACYIPYEMSRDRASGWKKTCNYDNYCMIEFAEPTTSNPFLFALAELITYYISLF